MHERHNPADNQPVAPPENEGQGPNQRGFISRFISRNKVLVAGVTTLSLVAAGIGFEALGSGGGPDQSNIPQETSPFAPSPSGSPGGSPGVNNTGMAEIGIHDGSVNACDNTEQYGKVANGTVTGTQPYYPGVGDAMNSPYFGALKTSTIRYIAPEDIADHNDPTDIIPDANKVLSVEQACMNALLVVAAEHHQTVMIDLRPDYNNRQPDGTPGGKIAVLNLRQSEKAMSEFLKTYSCGQNTCPLPPLPPGIHSYPSGYVPGVTRMAGVTEIGVNEPDFVSPAPAGLHPQAPQKFVISGTNNLLSDPKCSDYTSDSCGPVLAAHRWSYLKDHCPSDCTVIAGDMSARGGFETNDGSPTYLNTYLANLGDNKRKVFAVHPYGEVMNREFTALKDQQPEPLSQRMTYRFSDALRQHGYDDKSQIWINEISAFSLRHGHTYSPRIECDAMNYILHTMAQTGKDTPPPTPQGGTAPKVTQVDYMRYAPDRNFSMLEGSWLHPTPTIPYYAILNRNSKSDPCTAPAK